MNRSIAEYIFVIATPNRSERLCWISFSTKYHAAEAILTQIVIPDQLKFADKHILDQKFKGLYVVQLSEYMGPRR